MAANEKAGISLGYDLPRNQEFASANLTGRVMELMEIDATAPPGKVNHLGFEVNESSH
jgi:hypothetical protein